MILIPLYLKYWIPLYLIDKLVLDLLQFPGLRKSPGVPLNEDEYVGPGQKKILQENLSQNVIQAETRNESLKFEIYNYQ